MLELIISIGIVLLFIILLYYYLEWSHYYNSLYDIYLLEVKNPAPIIMTIEDFNMIKNYGWVLPTKYISDTYNPIRHFLIYNRVKMFGS